ncbi:MAG: hypothetical protein GTO14_22485 [Anaerolineales bacterium]|nr:hypothetical protein [Anaerolineales bacterium]
MDEHVANRSRDLFNSGFWCAESVLLAVSEHMGIDSDLIPKIATGFCSGMARTGGQCGALSGAIMSVSLFTGRSSPEASVDPTYSKVRRIRHDFKEKFGATDCVDLLGLDLATEDGQRGFIENNLIEKCLDYTEEATRMSFSLLDEEDSGKGENRMDQPSSNRFA